MNNITFGAPPEIEEKEEEIHELQEKIWGVISERGCEATDLTYYEAAALMRKLDGEKVYGLCIVTSETANRERAFIERED
jgi:hypothetical protein